MKNAIITSSGISWVSLETHSHYDIPKSHVNYSKIEKAIMDDEPDSSIVELINDPANTMTGFSGNKITSVGGVFYYKGNQLHHVVVDRIYEMKNNGYKFDHLVNFLNNLFDNSSMQSRESLYDFLEHKGLPVTDDGCFLAYKAVKNDYTDCYTGTFHNDVGAVISMDRNDVDDNRSAGCSHGFHVGSMEYVKGFSPSDGHIMLVKVNPADVVSVPLDCECQKVRVCKYEVVSEMTVPTGCGVDASGVNEITHPVTDRFGSDIGSDSDEDSSLRIGPFEEWEDRYICANRRFSSWKEIANHLHRSKSSVKKHFKKNLI